MTEEIVTVEVKIVQEGRFAWDATLLPDTKDATKVHAFTYRGLIRKCKRIIHGWFVYWERQDAAATIELDYE